MSIDEVIDGLECENEQTECFIKAHESWIEPAEIRERKHIIEKNEQLAEWLFQLKQIQDIVQEYHDNYIEWGTGQSSVAFHKIVKIIEGGEE